MQPSAFYADEEKTYAGGFNYKVTTSSINALYHLNDTLDNSISYTTPKNSKLDSMEMGGWNNTSASAYVDKQLYFNKDFGSSGHSNINSLTVSKGSFAEAGKTTICFAANPGAGYYYFGNSAEGSETKGSLNCKLITDMEINKIVFRASIPTGWTKADFDAFESNGSLADNDGYEISFSDFMANPSNYYIRTFTISALGYWDGSTWRANNLSNSPQIAPIFITDNAKTTGFLTFNKHHFDNAPGTGAYGISNVSVYNSSATNATNVNAWNRGAVVSGLSSTSGYILGQADTILLTPDLTGEECEDLTSQGVLGAGTTLPAKTLPFWDALKVYKYDQYTLTADSGSSGPSHFTRYNYYFCAGMRGDYFYKLLAYIGAYFYTGSLTDLNDSGATPDNMAVTGMKLGEMDGDGNTTGNWIGPDAMPAYIGPNKGGSIVHPDYNPSGGGGGDDDDPSDDQGWGGAYSGAGAFSKFYLCTATDLANLRTWFGGGGSGDQIPDGFDPMGQVLGLLQYPVSISGTALAAEEIVFRSGKTIIHTNVNATRSTGGFLHLDCGSVEIPRRMQQRGVPFLDFETTLEIYVPFCGTAPLDVQTCVGKTLTCDMYVATATGDVSAVIAAGGHPVAYMSGNMAESLPISSSGYGMYLAACKSTWGNGVSQVMNQLTGGTTDTLKNVNQAALNETLSYNQTGGWGRSELIAESYNNPKIGSAMAAAASPAGAAAIGLIKTGLNVINAATTGYEQYKRVKNASYTSVSGSFTSCAAWNYPFTPYVKITRPHKQIPTGDRGDYKHTAAIPLVETKTLSGAPGLTTCVNPDVSGIANATAQEKDIIYRALVNGVIV